MPTPKRMLGTPRSASPASTARVAGRAKRAYSAGDSAPAQLSKSWKACAPARICARSEATAMSASRATRRSHRSGAECMSALTRAKVRDGPPSTM